MDMCFEDNGKCERGSEVGEKNGKNYSIGEYL